MNADWKPGTVAMVTALNRKTPYRAFFDGEEWVECDSVHSKLMTPTSVRPLALIDYDDREAVIRLAGGQGRVNVGWLQDRLREFADPKPPRIDEPGTWGVVEAACYHDSLRTKWVRHEDGNWWPASIYRTGQESTPVQPDDWADLIDPVLVREGVTS